MAQQRNQAELDEKVKKSAKNHPDCIPILFLKHPQSPDYMKSPTHPFILFKKDLQIQEAMKNLYRQIEQKGLYFFIPYLSNDQVKYAMVKPGTTIEKIYKKYGLGGYLTLVYSDNQLGMHGIKRMEKWLIRFLVVLAVIWLTLFGYNYYLGSIAEGEASIPAPSQTKTSYEF